MAEISQRLPFSQLETKESRTAPFGTSFVVQTIAFAILLNLSFAAPAILEKQRYQTIVLTAPVEQSKLSRSRSRLRSLPRCRRRFPDRRR